MSDALPEPNWLAAALAGLPEPDRAAAAAVRERADNILRPAGALARLDDVAVFVAGWQGSTRPAISNPHALIFAADHGVAAGGVSNYPADVTAHMLAAYRARRSTITAFAAVAGAGVDAVDVGVGHPTGDVRHEPALSPERFTHCVDAGRAAVDAAIGAGTDLLVIGEMGIGNTTAAAAVAAALAGGDPAVWVGRGTGVDDDGLERKCRAVADAVQRIAAVHHPLEVLREVGGAELVAAAAAIVAARLRRVPVVLDGYVITAAAFALHRAQPGALDHCIAGHCSAEPGHRRLLDHIGLTPLLDLGMRLGEGSGAMAAVPLIRMSCAGVSEVPTFAEWFGAPPQD